MKIAAISDIHGNMEALEAVMEDIRKEKCDKIFVLGDYAMAGPQPAETIAWFLKRHSDSNFSMIQGNTDLMIAGYSLEIYENLKKNAPIMAEALKDDYAHINAIQRLFLRDLPPQLEVMVDDVKFLLVHGSPRRNNEDILPDTELREVEQMLENVDANVVLCGHTHIPCGFQTRKKQTVVNVGSVGRPFTKEPKACYLKITVSGSEYVLEHKFVEYNKERAALKLKARKFAGANILSNNLLDPQARHF